MKKKTETKENEEKNILPKKMLTAIKGETIHFILGLLCVIFGVYMLLAFSSFFLPEETTKVSWHIQIPGNCSKPRTAYKTMPEHAEPNFRNSL